MKKALALVIGNGDYDNQDDYLENAVNDASAIAEKLHNIGFDVILKKNCKQVGFNKVLKDFENKLVDYSAALFYYSGHAFQIERENYLSAVDSNFEDSDFAKSSCVPLQLVISKMNKAQPDIKILILDACRNNPLKEVYRGISENLAPVQAPKGSLIAFSTSPGERAADFGKDGHSIYTGCLLEHLEDPDVPIEVLFKRVRVSVNNISRGKQTPWEHTSMIDDFYFHSSGLVHAKDFPYDSQSLIYEQFVPKGSVVDAMIISLLSTQFSEQNEAALKVSGMASERLSPSEQFLLGRSLLWAANYGAYKAEDKINDLGNWVSAFNENGENHLLNGILFEIYFNGKGLLRKEFYKSSMLDVILAYENDKRFAKSFSFIREQLKPHRGYLFYIPGDGLVTINLILEEGEYDFGRDIVRKCHVLQSMKIGSRELYKSLPHDMRGSDLQSMEELRVLIVQYLLIPKSKLKLVSAYGSDEVKIISIPYGLNLREVMKEQDQ